MAWAHDLRQPKVKSKQPILFCSNQSGKKNKAARRRGRKGSLPVQNAAKGRRSEGSRLKTSLAHGHSGCNHSDDQKEAARSREALSRHFGRKFQEVPG